MDHLKIASQCLIKVGNAILKLQILVGETYYLLQTDVREMLVCTIKILYNFSTITQEHMQKSFTPQDASQILTY